MLSTRVQRLLIATSNRDKLREVRQLLGSPAFDLLTLQDQPPVPEPDETGSTFEANARLKARYYDRAFALVTDDGHFTVTEDSGLVIDALGGDPGIHSARYVRPDASYAERFDEIYRRLDEAPGAERTARFVCAVAVVHQGIVVFETTGTVEGSIADAPRGTGGFGYDPIFFYPPYGMTLGEVSSRRKRRISHRSMAIGKLARWLKGAGESTPRATHSRGV